MPILRHRPTLGIPHIYTPDHQVFESYVMLTWRPYSESKLNSNMHAAALI